MNPTALKNVGRTWNRLRFEEKYHMLRSRVRKVQIYIDLIYGIPGDTFRSYLDGIKYTMSLRPSKIQPHNLQILPGSAFWLDPDRFGIRYDPKPPHYVIESNTLSQTDMLQAQKWAVLLYVYFNPGVQAAILLLSRELNEEPFTCFTRLLRWLRRVVPLERVAREVDVDVATAARTLEVVERFCRYTLLGAGVTENRIRRIIEVVKYQMWTSTMRSTIGPQPVVTVQLHETVSPKVSEDVTVVTFEYDVSAIIDTLHSAPDLDAMPATETILVFNRALNEVHRISRSVQRFLSLCNGERNLATVIEVWRQEMGLPPLDGVPQPLQGLLGDLVRYRILELPPTYSPAR